jgi:hypothetical protein
LNFLDRFSKEAQVSNVIKIPPVGAEFFMRTDWLDEANFCFSQFCERA